MWRASQHYRALAQIGAPIVTPDRTVPAYAIEYSFTQQVYPPNTWRQVCQLRKIRWDPDADIVLQPHQNYPQVNSVELSREEVDAADDEVARVWKKACSVFKHDYSVDELRQYDPAELAREISQHARRLVELMQMLTSKGYYMILVCYGPTQAAFLVKKGLALGLQ